jgi:ubiquinone/menaquinone biosynthesis C-methylase UbiE
MPLKTNSEWLEWGRRDPLFGVASWENKSVTGAIPWTDEEFYALGESDWRDFDERWRRYGYNAGSFVEIGCGAGRITKQLVKAFASGHAFDVSDGMIRYAASHVASGNIEWHITDGLTIPLENNSVDAVFSCHVLQHFPSCEAGYACFAEIARVLKPGGTLMIHLPIHMFPVAVSRKFAALCEFLFGRLLFAIDVQSGYRRFRMRRGATPPMHGISYEQGKLYRALLRVGLVRVEMATFPLTSNGELHAFVMATKPKG